MSEARVRAALKLVDKAVGDKVCAVHMAWDSKISAAAQRLKDAEAAVVKKINDAIKNAAKKFGATTEERNFSFTHNKDDSRWSTPRNLIRTINHPTVLAASREVEKLKKESEAEKARHAVDADKLRKQLVMVGLTDAVVEQLNQFVGD